MANKKKQIKHNKDDNYGMHFLNIAKNVKEENIYNYNKAMMEIYGANVNLARAIPDVRDCLKGVERRILYTMYKDENMRPNGRRKKVSKILGTCKGTYYPHGDMAIYLVMVGLGQWWNLNPMLIDKQGNFGTVFGDPPAAERYIEAGMSDYAYDSYFSEWNNRICEFSPNYTQETVEPVYLPSKYPNILTKGSFGIGYGLATSIPPHNINEVIDLTIKLMDNADMKDVYLYPDFPIECDIMIPDEKEYITMCRKGEGSVKLRGRMIVDDKDNIVITSIPHGTTTNAIINKITELKNKKKMFSDIIDYVDESVDKKGIRKINITLNIRKGANPYLIIEQLYRSTPLENSVTLNYEAVYNYVNYHFSMKSLLTTWLDFRRETKQRILHYEYSKFAKEYFNITFLLNVIETNEENKLIKIMKSSSNRSSIIKELVKCYGITDVQADAIADLKFSQLSKDNVNNLREQKAKLDKSMKKLTDKMSNDKYLDEEIKEELLECKKKYGRKRLCPVIKLEKEKIPNTNHIIIITKDGDIKKLFENETDYGHLKSKPIGVIKTNNKDSLLIFNSHGRVFNVNINDVVSCDINTKGVPLKTYIVNEDPIVSALPKSALNKKGFLIFVTESGNVKKTSVSHYLNVTKNIGLSACVVKKSDTLKNVLYIEKEQDIILYTRNGKGLRINTKDIPETLRVSSGVIGIRLEDSDFVLGSCIIDKNDDYIFMVTNKGFGKKCDLNNFERSERAIKGYNLIDLDDENYIAGAKTIQKNGEILVYCLHDDTILNEKDIPELTRKSKGKKIVKVPKGDLVIDVE